MPLLPNFGFLTPLLALLGKVNVLKPLDFGESCFFRRGLHMSCKCILDGLPLDLDTKSKTVVFSGCRYWDTESF